MILVQFAEPARGNSFLIQPGFHIRMTHKSGETAKVLDAEIVAQARQQRTGCRRQERASGPPTRGYPARSKDTVDVRNESLVGHANGDFIRAVPTFVAGKVTQHRAGLIIRAANHIDLRGR